MIRKLPVILFLAGVVVFDAFQQKYYLDTFDLHPEGLRLSVLDLLRSHATRWVVYALVHLPLFALLYRRLPAVGALSGRDMLKIAGLLLVGLSTTLVSISVISVLRIEQALSISSIVESLQFFFYQKGLTYLIVSAGLLLLVISMSQKRELDEKQVAIRDLNIERSRLKDALSSEKEAELHMKIGNREHVIALSKIVWIQSDDYCVKVHTDSKSYTVRRSLVKLAEELAPYGFVRIHRSAVLNTNYLDYIDYQNSLIKLTNDASVPFSKSGIKALKHSMESTSDH